MARIGTWVTSHAIAAAGLALAGIFVFAFAAVGVALATDQPAFCNAACHEMRPYHAAWSAGPHKDVRCIDCHVEAGIPARLAHKTVALRELWVHVSGDPTFPLTTATPVPDERCVRCHESIRSADSAFDHDLHASRGSCQSCHATAGHEVTTDALAAAGILDSSPRSSVLSTRVATVDGGSANVTGHPAQSCSRCHDLAKTGCPACHTAEHDATGPAVKSASCETCHEPSGEFAFAHPPQPAECASCHKQPAEKHDYANSCTTCHTTPGVTWAFAHPKSSAKCSTCHVRPAKHQDGSCASCHRKTGSSWAFTHPKSAACTSCHARPASHRSGSCTSCHRSSGVSWAFYHPRSSSCTSCHARPSGHRSGSCSSCHTSGRSWAFRHTGSSRCSTCHKAPSNHFGSSCASCHSTSRSWSSARFSHPRIRGGEHSYRSFACSKCHPSGYGSATCSKCHKSSSGPRDDEEDEDDDD